MYKNMNREHVPNNSRSQSDRLRELNIGRVWEDDGNIGVVVDRERFDEVVEMVRNLEILRVGDGVQEGSVWVSSTDETLNEEVSGFGSL